MGLLDKVKKLENVRKDKESPRYFLFKFIFESLLKDIGAKRGAFLVKQGRNFCLAFPINIDCVLFRKYLLDATLILPIEEGKYDPFVLFDKVLGGSIEMELLNTSLLYKLDDLGCVFLLLDFDDRLSIIKNSKEMLLSKIGDFKGEYEKNRILVDTSIPPFQEYLSTSSIESKMRGATLACTIPNFFEFTFFSMFDFSSLHEDKDNLPLFYSIVNRIKKMIGRYNFAILDKNLVLNTCIFSSLTLDFMVYTSTLKTVLSSIYGKDLIDKLGISVIKTLHDKNERITSWILENYNPLDVV